MDTLIKWFKDKTNSNMTELQLFQAGVTKGAVSMRERAMKVVETAKPPDDDTRKLFSNAVKNGIGQLSDIPQE